MHNYHTLSYRRYTRKEVDFNKYLNAYDRRISNRLKILKDWQCLDIACGYGNFLAYLRNIGVVDYLGVDSSENAIKTAAAEFGASHVVCQDVFRFLREEPKKYDLISALDFLEHLTKEELFSFLELANKHQDPEGTLLIRTPNASGLFGMSVRYSDITHEISFTPGAIKDVLEQNGYHVISIWEDGAAKGSVFQTIHCLTWTIMKSLIRLIHFAETGSLGDGILARNMWVLAKRSENE